MSRDRVVEIRKPGRIRHAVALHRRIVNARSREQEAESRSQRAARREIFKQALHAQPPTPNFNEEGNKTRNHGRAYWLSVRSYQRLGEPLTSLRNRRVVVARWILFAATSSTNTPNRRSVVLHRGEAGFLLKRQDKMRPQFVCCRRRTGGCGRYKIDRQRRSRSDRKSAAGPSLMPGELQQLTPVESVRRFRSLRRELPKLVGESL